MSRILNLYDLHKKRVALITEDCKELIINYQPGASLLTSKQAKDSFNTLKFPIYSELINCSIEIEFGDKDILIIKVSQRKSDLNKLYKVFLVIAFLFGTNLQLNYYYENFPFYAIPHDFNIGGYLFDISMRRWFLTNPKDYLEVGYKLLLDDNSMFYKVVPPLLEINTISSPFIRFFAEYSLLEVLVKEYSNSDTKIISKNSPDFDQLKTILNDAMKIVQDKFDTRTFEMLKEKLNIENINTKGNAKDKLMTFLQKEELVEYIEYIKAWNMLRNKKSIAHGSVWASKNVKITDEDKRHMEKMHTLLTSLVFHEFHNQVLNT